MDSFIALDLETTGFSAVSNEIIEIGAWKIENGVAVAKFGELIKPRGYISREIQRITNISPDMVEDCRDIAEVLPEFLTFCGDLPFLGHNLPFDYDFLVNKGQSCGCDFTNGGKRVGIDTLFLSRTYFREFPSHKLGAMAEQLNINVRSDGNTGYHRAMYDAYVAKLLYDRFLVLYGDIPNVSTPAPIRRDEIKYGTVVNNDTLSFE